MPVITLPLLGTGILLALVFSNYQKNILKGIGETSFELPLSVISSFSDLMSYLRLFAVGFASVQVASSFNNIAIGTGIDNILKGFIAAIVLLFGHSLNIVLGLMAVLVHGVRLNMLEFSGHLRQQWSGREYKPFRE
jgi:V/A-type H+-transporting ATPase subunit I